MTDERAGRAVDAWAARRRGADVADPPAFDARLMEAVRAAGEPSPLPRPRPALAAAWLLAALAIGVARFLAPLGLIVLLG